MADIAFTAASIRPLVGSITKPYPAGGAGGVGDAVYVASDGDVEVADADGAATAQAIGIVTAVGNQGKLTFAAGDMVDVTLWGPVAGWTGATPGDLAYVSVTAGNVADAAPGSGDYIWVVGQVVAADVINVKCFTYDATVVP
jgi:large exoprotein involved in heme utilization and adhesion